VKTLVDVFRHAAGSSRPDLLRQKREGRWNAISAERFGATVRAISAGLAAAGVGRGDRVAILSDNRPEWSMIDFGVVCRGAVTVPIYTSYQPPQVEELLTDVIAIRLSRRWRRSIKRDISGLGADDELLSRDRAGGEHLPDRRADGAL